MGRAGISGDPGAGKQGPLNRRMPELHRSVTGFLRAAPLRKCRWGCSSGAQCSPPLSAKQLQGQRIIVRFHSSHAMCARALAHFNWVFTPGNQVSGFPSSHAHMTHGKSQEPMEVLLLHQLMKPSTIPAREALGSGPHSRQHGPQRDVCPRPRSRHHSPGLSPPGDFGDLSPHPAVHSFPPVLSLSARRPQNKAQHGCCFQEQPVMEGKGSGAPSGFQDHRQGGRS